MLLHSLKQCSLNKILASIKWIIIYEKSEYNFNLLQSQENSLNFFSSSLLPIIKIIDM